MKVLAVRNENEFVNGLTKKDFAQFLHESLDRFTDPVDDIIKSIDYAFSTEGGKGGFLLTAYNDEGELVSGLVMNQTGHEGYIPENILVYIATKPDQRGKGIGKLVMEKAIEVAGTDIALHVEYDNPAKRLYERIGFKSKYAEMRFKK
jgi:[ribosomal protein S18]-alanine N-acetyltransferase